MSKKIIVLGAGLVGNAIAIDLKKSGRFQITSVDIQQEALEKLSKNYNIQTIKADLSKSETVKSVVKDFALVICAVPGFMGYNTVKNVIEAGKNIVDISFFPEDCFKLDEPAKKYGVTAITDCGVAPGMCNIILGYHNKRMKINRYVCYVGGLPVVREWPYEYKAVFSPADVIEEYIRPARYVAAGKLVTKDALSDCKLLNFEKIGTLTAFNSDGLRSLLQTMDIPNMIEKTMRYPGSIKYLKALRETGFFSYEKIDIQGKKIRPIDLTSKLLSDIWKLNPGEEDFTVMKIIIEGNEHNKEKTYIYNLFDRYDKKTNTISMARTTGYTCTAVANLLIEGKFNRKGICPPEYLGEDEENFKFILNYLKERQVIYKRQVKSNK